MSEKMSVFRKYKSILDQFAFGLGTKVSVKAALA